jgi:5'-nucleotidase/UDP-sugar diphosphatase
MRKNTLAITLIVALLWAVPTLACADTFNLSLLYTNDTHGHLQSFSVDSGKPVGGIAKRAIFMKEKRRHQKMFWLTLDGGDAISGTALSDVFQGFLDIEAMNRLGYDAMALGVHEFDYGVDVLRQRMAEAKFPVLSANVVLETTGQPFAKPYVIVERGGVKIAIFGLTTAEIESRVAQPNFVGLRVLDPVDTARQLVSQLQGQAEVIVALTHLGVNEDIRLASQVPGIDVIVGGMSHSELQVPMKVGQTLVVQDAMYGKSIGLLKLSFSRDAASGLERVYFDNALEQMDGTWAENTDYLSWLGGYKTEMTERMGTIVGTATTRMSAAKVKSSETELGNFVTDVLRQQTGADAALLPAAFFRNGIADGPVTLGDLYSAMPYDQYAVVLTVTGGELQEILNDASDQIGKPGFPQVSGLSFGIYNGRASEPTIRVGGLPLDAFAQYRLVTSDFAAEGGLNYSSLGTIKNRMYTGRLIRDLVREKLGSGQAITAKMAGRITFLAQEPLPPAPPEEPAEPVITEESAPEVVAEVPAEPTPAPESEPAIIEPEGTFIPDEEPRPAAGNPGENLQPGEIASSPDTPVETESPAEPAESTSGNPGENLNGGPLEDTQFDRTGMPMDEPVRIEDEVVADAGSTAGNPGETLQPADSPSSTGTVADGQEIGSSTGTANGLSYSFSLLKKGRGYEFVLTVTNESSSPVSLTYPTGRRFDFYVYEGSDVRWNYNHNRFFTQAIKTQSVAPGEVLEFRGDWNGATTGQSMLPKQVYRFEAVHDLQDSPVRLEFEAQLQ